MWVLLLIIISHILGLLSGNARNLFNLFSHSKNCLKSSPAVLRSQKKSEGGRFAPERYYLRLLWRRRFGVRLIITDSSCSTASVYPQPRDLTEDEADQNRNQWVLADLP